MKPDLTTMAGILAGQVLERLAENPDDKFARETMRDNPEIPEIIDTAIQEEEMPEWCVKAWKRYRANQDGRIQEGEEKRLDTIAKEFEDELQVLINHHQTQAKCAMGGEAGWSFRGPGFKHRMRKILQSKLLRMDRS